MLFTRMVRADSDDTPHLSRLGQSRKSLSSKSSTAGASSNSDNSFPAVRERVQMGIATSQSHSEVLQDMVLNLSSAEGKRDIEHEKKLLKDLVKEMVQFRQAVFWQEMYSYTAQHVACCLHIAHTLHARLLLVACLRLYDYNRFHVEPKCACFV